jgi:DnaJ-class molecular chaperone
MTMSDRQIPEKDRCPACGGAGWTWWSADATSAQEGKWVVCRECIGTGRTDQKGRKRQKPADAPGS